jgi:uncharacterized protein (DUF1778 family)
LKARQAADPHAMLKRAADIQGRALVDFVATAAQNAARHMIEDADMIRLSLADQERFAQALLDPSALAPAMERAFERHRRLVGPT